MTVKELKQHLIDYAREILPDEHAKYLRITGNTSQNFMQIESRDSKVV